ncbi:Myb-related protein B [Phytophthora nicotianae]|uniref:Myb-related protein B n=1 Tax=Phytophthora nicotianae TaxID=4792 RepID=A0A0W8DIE0_PHYNI|nr:Myb-related protein B [Phytophthora nicotianae]
MDLKVDFKNYHSPPRADFNDVDAIHNHSAETQDIESSVVDNNPGQPLYNAEIYGSLRKGGAVKFFSMDCVGLVAATFASTFSMECLNSVILPMLKEHFGLKTAELAAAKRLTSIPLAFCFFIGLLSDSYPILGFRRKGYLIIGLATTVLSFFVLSGLDGYIETMEDGTAGTGLAVAIITFATLASTGNIMTYVCIQTRVLELSQREPLVCEELSPEPLLVFGIVVALSIPLVWKAWQEKYYSLSTPMKTRGQILWRIMQQKAVWSILMFMCFYTLFAGIAFSGPSVIISVWAGASGDNTFVQQLMYYGAMLFTIVAWRYYFMNRPWRAFYGMSIVLLIIPQLVLAILVTQDTLRDRYFYRFMTLFTSISAGIGWLSSLIPLTEIIQEGSEGAMVGLMLSLYFLVTAFVQTNAEGLLNGTNFYNIAEVALDTSEARSDVLKALILNYGINALAFIGLYFLPRQKLDTQQLRSYGGYTKCASAAIVTFAVVLFLYSLIITVLTLNPSTSCLSIAGGDGC